MPNITDYDRLILAARPYLYWPLGDALSGPLDLSPNGRNPTAVTGPTTRGVLAPGGGSDRYGSYWAAGQGASINPTAFTITDNFTAEIWIYPISVTATNQGVYTSGTSVSGWGLLMLSSLQVRGVLGNVGFLGTSAQALALNQWSHVVFLRAAGIWRLWINGKQNPAAIGSANPITPTGDVGFPAAGNPNHGRQLYGFALYERVLTGDEIVAHFQYGSYPITPPILVDAPPQEIPPPFLNVGTGLYAPLMSPPVTPPFLSVGVGIKPANLVDGPPPPVVPPSLPPTIPPGTPDGPGAPLPPLSSGGLAGIRFYQGPPWRWLITDLQTNSICFLDKLAAEAVVTYGLDRGWSAKLSVPADNRVVKETWDDGEPNVTEGTRLLYGFRREGSGPLWQCRFAGKILNVEDVGLAEDARTIITAYDGWHLCYQRPMVNFEGFFPDQAGFFSFDDTQTGVIALTFLRNAIVNALDDGPGIDMGDQDFANIQPSGSMPGTPWWGSPYKAPWSGRPKSVYEDTTQIDTDCQQGMMLAEVWDQQIDTGTLDIMLTPIYDPVNRPGYINEIAIYERMGSEASDAVFSWDKPGRNLVGINRLKDGTKRANTIRYYEQQGGKPVNSGIPLSYGPSILKYGETWHEQFWPGRIEAAVLALEQLQLDLLQDGILTVEVHPTTERMPFLFTEWFLGDTVPVFASAKLRAPLAGFQRIYGVVLNIDENGYEQVPQVLVSPDTAS